MSGSCSSTPAPTRRGRSVGESVLAFHLHNSKNWETKEMERKSDWRHHLLQVGMHGSDTDPGRLISSRIVPSFLNSGPYLRLLFTRWILRRLVPGELQVMPRTGIECDVNTRHSEEKGISHYRCEFKRIARHKPPTAPSIRSSLSHHQISHVPRPRVALPPAPHRLQLLERLSQYDSRA
jgi:hypothetical protein